jgi:hypothetical protein
MGHSDYYCDDVVVLKIGIGTIVFFNVPKTLSGHEVNTKLDEGQYNMYVTMTFYCKDQTLTEMHAIILKPKN